MSRLLTVATTAVALLAAGPAWACIPPPPNASYETSVARAAFVGRVVSVERTPPEACIVAARARAAAPFQGDPGERGCEAFGFATLEPAWIIKGGDVVSGRFRVAWNQTPFCTVGWTPEIGALAVAMVPEDPTTLRDGTTAVVEGVQQGDLLFSIILELVAKIQP